MKISYSSVQSINISRIFKRNGTLSQTLNPIIIEQASYCIQFEVGTETVKILKFDKTSPVSEQLIIDLSDWRELESETIRDLEKIGNI